MHRIELGYKEGILDPFAELKTKEIREFLHIPIEKLWIRRIYFLDIELTEAELKLVAENLLANPFTQLFSINHNLPSPSFNWSLVVAFKPGVTDNVGNTAKEAVKDILNIVKFPDDKKVYTATQYLFKGQTLSSDSIEGIASGLLANSIIEDIKIQRADEWELQSIGDFISKIDLKNIINTETIDLNVDDKKLMKISKARTLALNLKEMQTIKNYFNQEEIIQERKEHDLTNNPTDVELEALAQTWSEHCQHKIFNSQIEYTNKNEEWTIIIDSLFKTYIKKSTEELSKNIDWLVSVFSDNAGVIKFNDHLNLVYKVETHNSPSAIDPYGGAMTGIVGVNRDPLGTGKGANLLINVWGYCLGNPFYTGEMPGGLLHPKRIRDGVHKGVIDGGNQSGIPYGLGWELFDDRYSGKPLIYCGTVGFMPRIIGNKLSHLKKVNPSDCIVMVGGRVGKDGIHGATFSSEELHEGSPIQAVQIGDPITQKKMEDFLIEARDLDLYNFITDNGAGGLSSSVGEMARGSNGCRLDLAKVPLKYEGCQPWEILLSEAQERMTLAVSPDKIGTFLSLANRREVEATVIGSFEDNGIFHITYGDKTVAYIDMDFFQNGCPKLELTAIYEPRLLEEPEIMRESAKIRAQLGAGTVLRNMLERLNICSKEEKCRQYDHEVKGLSIIKPFVGIETDCPSDATIFLAEYGSVEGIVLSYGVNPYFSDLDTYHMTASVIDEAIRKIVAVGGRPDYIAGLDNFCWPDSIQSEKTPDGHYKLAQLVRANQALYDYTKAFKVPLISGKDSMFNDCTKVSPKISIPPTLLFSAIGKIDDIRKAVSMDVKSGRDLVYIAGITRNELGGSEFYRYLGEKLRQQPYIGNKGPQVDAEQACKLYRMVSRCVEKELIHSLHTPTLGGLGVALAMMSFAGNLGLEIDLGAVPIDDIYPAEIILFSESNSRLIFTIPPENKVEVEAIIYKSYCQDFVRQIGRVRGDTSLIINHLNNKPLIKEDIMDLKKCWKQTFSAL
ncbi:MAG: AIR synthase-related protein [bacterium]